MRDHPAINLARAAGLIGEPTRAAMLNALLSGESLPAGELARRAGVTAQTASEHLGRLVEGGLITRRQAGRHRYYELAGAEVAGALEALACISWRPPASEPKPSVEHRMLRFARTCYDHMAGSLGVMLANRLVQRHIIAESGYEVTAAGEAWLRDLDIEVAALRPGRRPLVRPCMDWSERQHHIAGSIGAALADTFFRRRWLVRLDGTRAVRLTLRGRDGLYRVLGLEIP